MNRDSPWHRIIAVLIAIVAGTGLRFYHLGQHQLSIDEAASWVAAAEPTIPAVIRKQTIENPGKLAVHEILLHEWIATFSESEAAIRSLSAILGVLTLGLILLTETELLGRRQAPFGDLAITAGVYTVLMCAASLELVKVSRDGRMYATMLAFLIAQVAMVLRARRNPSSILFAGIAVTTALAIGTNFTAGITVAVEAIWILYLVAKRLRAAGKIEWTSELSVLAALVAGGVLLMPFSGAIQGSAAAGAHGIMKWIAPPDRWEPFSTFESANGSWIFPFIAIFGVSGAYRWWQNGPREEFILAMMWLCLPPLAMLAVSYLFSPMLVTRYVLSSLVPLLIFAAVGMASIQLRRVRLVMVVGLFSVMMIRAAREVSRPATDQFREATAAAAAAVSSEGRIGSAGAGEVVKYYLPPDRRAAVELMSSSRCGFDCPAVLVLFVLARTGPEVAAFRRTYPQVLGVFKPDLLVLSRDTTI